ncbi:hypothetical protein AAE02nite_46570 [Adhaeribacter aerolatus]|uniref:Uncharacterized protein n=1 Tax=Adhaeribacter aerolatus TaxID=670289 RepID=A0A512B4U7_9BACT|nr:hypothetical protein AAE02nite_46570 [Adhaeribacter aerolatus]
MKTLKNILSVIFIVYTGLLIIVYFGSLYEKIVRPEYKNLDFEGFFLLGLVVLFLLFIDVILVKRLIMRIKSKEQK